MIDETVGTLDSSDQARLYVLGLPESLREDLLFLLFCSYGRIIELGIKRDKVFGDHGRFGFVHFDSPDAAQVALQTLDGQALDGNTVRVRVAVPQDEIANTVWVRRISDNVLNEGTLSAIFGRCGEIASCIVSEDSDGTKTGSAFIRFVDADGAQKAILTLNERIGDVPAKFPRDHNMSHVSSVSLDSPLSVMLANHSSDAIRPRPPLSSKINSKPPGVSSGPLKFFGSPAAGYGPKTSHPHESTRRSVPYGGDSKACQDDAASRRLYVHNLPPRWTDAELRDFFTRFGEVEAVLLQRDPITGVSNQSGFVVMRTAAQARLAARKGTGETIEGHTITCRTSPRGAPLSIPRQKSSSTTDDTPDAEARAHQADLDRILSPDM